MYYIVMAEGCEITLEGMPINPADHPITIVGNGNPTWIGYPFSEGMTVTDAFTALPPQNNDIFRSSSGNSTYNRGRWSQGIELTPGFGYIYKSAPNSADRTFTYPTSAK